MTPDDLVLVAQAELTSPPFADLAVGQRVPLALTAPGAFRLVTRQARFDPRVLDAQEAQKAVAQACAAGWVRSGGPARWQKAMDRAGMSPAERRTAALLDEAARLRAEVHPEEATR